MQQLPSKKPLSRVALTGTAGTISARPPRPVVAAKAEALSAKEAGVDVARRFGHAATPRAPAGGNKFEDVETEVVAQERVLAEDYKHFRCFLHF